jgi:hypothetical protein
METTEDLDLTTDEALLSSLSEHKIDELKLYSFSLLRQTVATDLCDLGSGSLFNAIMTIWVCTLTPEEALAAHQNLTKAKLQAFEWAEKRGYSLANYDPVLEMYKRLQKEFSAAIRNHVPKTELNGDGDAPVPNSGGQPT